MRIRHAQWRAAPCTTVSLLRADSIDQGLWVAVSVATRGGRGGIGRTCRTAAECRLYGPSCAILNGLAGPFGPHVRSCASAQRGCAMGVRGVWRIAVAVAVVLVALVHPAKAAQFEEIVPGTIPDSVGIAWGDYDGDGYPDLFVAGYNHPDQLAHGPLIFRNNHDLTFTDVSASLGLPSAPVDNEGAAWADYDNDGRLDVLSSCDSGTPFLFHQGASQFALVTPPSGLVGAGPTTGAAWCDYAGDGLLDVFVPTPGEGYLFHNNGDGTFTDVHVAAGVVTSAPGSTTAAAWGDFDNDGRPDLMITPRQRSGPALPQQRRWHVHRCQRQVRAGGRVRHVQRGLGRLRQ